MSLSYTLYELQLYDFRFDSVAERILEPLSPYLNVLVIMHTANQHLILTDLRPQTAPY